MLTLLMAGFFAFPVQGVTYFLKGSGSGQVATPGSWFTDTTNSSTVFTGIFNETSDTFVFPSGISAKLDTSWRFGSRTGGTDYTPLIIVNGSLTLASAGSITFIGKNKSSATCTLRIYGTIIFTSASANQISSDDDNKSIMTLTLNSGATLISANANGIVGTGNQSINSVGFDTLHMDTSANYYFNGLSQKMTGIPSKVNNLIFSGTGTVIYSAVTIVFGNFSISGGATVNTNVLTIITGNAVISGSSTWLMGGTLVFGSTTLSNTARILSAASAAKTFTGLLTNGNAATFDMSANNPNIILRGGITNYGTFIPGSGIYTIGSNPQTITGEMSFGNLTLTAATQLAAGSRLSVSGTLTTNDHLVLKSSATGTASLGIMGTVIGKIAVERFIPANRKFRFLASPVVGATIAQWRNNGDNTPGLGFHVTGNGGEANNFDPSLSNNPSAFTFNEANAGSTGMGSGTDSGWTPVVNGNNSGLTNGQGFRVMVRGDRTVSLTSANPPPTNTTIRVTGTYAGASKTINVSKTNNLANSGYNLLGNPYPSSISWNAITKNNVSGTFYTFSPNSGCYVSWNGSTGSATDNISSCQAFFVYASGPGSITVNEGDKVSGNGGSFYKSGLKNHLKLTLKYDSNYYDDQYLHFRSDATAGFEFDKDAYHLTNTSMNFYSYDEQGVKYSINCQPELSGDREIPLGLAGTIEANYKIIVSGLISFANTRIFLLDKLTGNVSEITTEEQVLTISHDAQSVSKAENRFVIRFVKSALGVNERELSRLFTLYPNPAGSEIHLSLETSQSGSYNYSIINELGQEKGCGSIDFNAIESPIISIENYEPGMYFLKLSGISGSQTLHFVK